MQTHHQVVWVDTGFASSTLEKYENFLDVLLRERDELRADRRSRGLRRGNDLYTLLFINIEEWKGAFSV